MDDKQIVDLYWSRDEAAVRETAAKYGSYCGRVAGGILADWQDMEECVSDTWLGAWNAMPPQRPRRLPPFLGRIARNTALDRYDYNTAQSRSGFSAVLEELSECVGNSPMEEDFDLRRLGETISAYLDTVSPECRRVFLRRYWYCDSLQEIAAGYGFTQGKVKSLLHRARRGLRAYLIEEGYDL